MVTTARKLTYEDYAKTPDDERYELIDGELVEMPSPRFIHQRVLLNLIWWFKQVEEMDLGIVCHAPFDVFFSDTVILQPDLMFVSRERAHIITEDNLQGAPDVAIEILSSSDPDRDRVRKREIYERYGVSEYWLVDPDARDVTVLSLHEGAYRTAGIYGEGDTLTSPTLRGFTLDLSELF